MLRHWLLASALALSAVSLAPACGGGPLALGASATPTPWVTDRPATVDATGPGAPARSAAASPTGSPRPSASPSPGPPAKTSPGPTASPSPAAVRQLELTNQARAGAGLPPLSWSPCLADIAAAHALAMAGAGRIFHADGPQRALQCGLGASRAGENVGMNPGGIDDQRIFTVFMNSPGHRANILGPYRYLGAAWVVGADLRGYVAVEFAG